MIGNCTRSVVTAERVSSCVWKTKRITTKRVTRSSRVTSVSMIHDDMNTRKKRRGSLHVQHLSHPLNKTHTMHEPNGGFPPHTAKPTDFFLTDFESSWSAVLAPVFCILFRFFLSFSLARMSAFALAWQIHKGNPRGEFRITLTS